MFDIPVVIFIFKRLKVVNIIKQISKIKPNKLYIIADGPRNEYENDEIIKCRKAVENSINWDCKVIKNYSELNRGIYENIALGAKWVFSQERYAIFLEDDNFPELSFFYFCREMLLEYEDNEKILWICGSNYLEKYEDNNIQSYYFTQHMLPCGWASWSEKFLHFYDFDLKNFSRKTMRTLKKRYIYRGLYYDYSRLIECEYNKIMRNNKPISWDYHMDFSIKFHNVYGICPAVNQIKNIGVDEYSIHGGTSLSDEMTARFCERKTYHMEFPLIHPKEVKIDKQFEKTLGKKILIPLKQRLRLYIMLCVKRIFNIPLDKSIFRRKEK